MNSLLPGPFPGDTLRVTNFIFENLCGANFIGVISVVTVCNISRGGHF